MSVCVWLYINKGRRQEGDVGVRLDYYNGLVVFL